jgi:hypothetical protein
MAETLSRPRGLHVLTCDGDSGMTAARPEIFDSSNCIVRRIRASDASVRFAVVGVGVR